MFRPHPRLCTAEFKLIHQDFQISVALGAGQMVYVSPLTYELWPSVVPLDRRSCPLTIEAGNVACVLSDEEFCCVLRRKYEACFISLGDAYVHEVINVGPMCSHEAHENGAPGSRDCVLHWQSNITFGGDGGAELLRYARHGSRSLE